MQTYSKKLSEYLRQENANNYAAIDAAKHLEAASELLYGLIDLMRHKSVGFTCDAEFKEWGMFDVLENDWSTGRLYSSPLEAAKGAVAKYKNET